MPALTRHLGGYTKSNPTRLFTLYGSHRLKRDAQASARAVRREGYLARVLKAEDGYAVYIRRKK